MDPQQVAQLQAALDAWRQALGPQHVLTEAPALATVQTATFATAQRVPAILRPGSREEVQQCLRIANEHRVPVYPVSGGRNYGYGSRVPPRDGCAVMELGRLNRIVELNEELAYLTVEPGVTFQQAYQYLRERDSRLFIAAIGGPPQSSLIGNALERGDGAGPNGDVFNHVCGLEVVLPTGECLHTGHARFAGARTGSVFRWGVGPSLDGLFSQSNLGVVTRMTFWLARRPAFFRQIFACVDEPGPRARLIDGLRELALEGTLRGTFFLWNDYKALSIAQQYPYEALGGRTPLPAAVMEEFRAQWPGGRWNLSGALYGPTEEQGLATQRRIEQVLGGAARTLRFLSEEELGGPATLQGVPSARNFAMAYWRKPLPQPEAPDPDRDGCGFIWLSCAVPLTGAHVTRAQEIAESLPPLFGFEPNLALIGISARCLYLVAVVIYDRAAPGQDARAMACHHALLRELSRAGYPPARLGIQAMTPPVPPDDDSARVQEAIKAALDPNRVLAPGRYEP